jgi:hypothetical protein
VVATVTRIGQHIPEGEFRFGHRRFGDDRVRNINLRMGVLMAVALAALRLVGLIEIRMAGVIMMVGLFVGQHCAAELKTQHYRQRAKEMDHASDCAVSACTRQTLDRRIKRFQNSIPTGRFSGTVSFSISSDATGYEQ